MQLKWFNVRRIFLFPIIIFTLIQCDGGPPGSSSQMASGPAYELEADPLVNPPELFMELDETQTNPVSGDDTFVRLLIGEPRTLNPLFYVKDGFYFLEVLYDSLFVRDQNMRYGPNPSRVVSMDESADRRVTTIHLRPDLTWHDGHPWTAEDIRFSWQAITDDRVPASAWKRHGALIEDVRVIDATTLEIVHQMASPTNAMNMSFPIIPAHIYGKADEREQDPSLQRSAYYNTHNRDKIVGSGPYRFVEWITNDRIVVERWEDYSWQKPHFKRQVFKIQPDRNMALLLFKKGEVDEIFLTPMQFATQTNDSDYARHGVKGFGDRWMFAYVGWNMDGSNPFFGDARVRKALAHAYDGEKVLRDVTYGLYQPTVGLFAPDHYCFNDDINPIPYDTGAAAALLDEAGWFVNVDDGWRYKDVNGKPVKFEFELGMAQSFADAVRMAEIYRNDLRKLGIEMRTRVLENAAFNQGAQRHEFDAIVDTIVAAADPDQWWSFYHSDQYPHGRNLVGYKNDHVDALLSKGRSEFEPGKRASYYSEIQELIYDEQPHLFLWRYSTLHGFNKGLRGVQLGPDGPFMFYPGHRAWWMAESDGR
jgi:peptide/nickel transport system substrate-binding protein